MTDIPDNKVVTVCDKCLTAACWQGRFYCDYAKTAGTTEMFVRDLRKLKLENEDYWR